jgi:hypothetical protein
MPDNLTIPPIGTGPPPSSSQRERPRDRGRPRPAPAKAARGDATPATPASTPATAHLDAALGIVVIQFSGDDGAGSSSIPTAQQLQAYRSGLPIDPSREGAAHAPAPAATAPGATGIVI